MDQVEVGQVMATLKGLRGYQVYWTGRPERVAEREVRGTVIFVDYQKKFGFLRPDGVQRMSENRCPDDVLFHITSAADYSRTRRRSRHWIAE